MKGLITIPIILIFITCSYDITAAENNLNLTLLYTGEEIGHIEPCGCAANNSGGLSRRDATISSIKKTEKNVLLLENGDIVGGTGRQEELKYKTAISAMNVMGYTALNVGEKDILLGIDYLKGIEKTAQFPILSCNLYTQTGNIFTPSLIKTFKEGDSELRIAIIGIISKEFENPLKNINKEICIEEPANVLKPLLKNLSKQSDIIILLAHVGKEEAEKLAKEFPEIDIMVYSHYGDMPLAYPSKVENTIILNSGQQGKNIGKLNIIFDTNGIVLERKHEIIPLGKNIPDSPEISKLLASYQEIVEKENLLTGVEKKPSPDGEYRGNIACELCHPDEELKWEKTRHAKAYESLVTKKHHSDPECVKCHVIGFEYTTGFKNFYDTPGLANVGCESCHGPGSRHIEDDQKAYGEVNQTDCQRCHIGEHSPDFNYDRYYEKIRH